MSFLSLRFQLRADWLATQVLSSVSSRVRRLDYSEQPVILALTGLGWRRYNKSADRSSRIVHNTLPTDPFFSRAEASSPYASSRRLVSSRFFASRVLILSRNVATMFCLDARSRSRDADVGGATSGMVLRDRMMRPRNPSWLYNHAVETAASAATVRKLISRSEASMRCRAAKVCCIALSLRKRTLRLRPIQSRCLEARFQRSI
jgi:hypothetical protein